MDRTVLEHVVRRAGLAVRCLDLATGRPVPGDLRVTAWHRDRPGERARARVAGGGVAGFAHLPGLRAYEDGSAAREDWSASPPARDPQPLVVRVEDPSGDHLTVLTETLVPRARVLDVVLPRGPAAPLPPAHLAVVAGIRTEAGEPAAWAVLEVVGTAPGARTTGGVADARGQVLVPVPRTGPPTGPGDDVTGPRWGVRLRVRYRPGDRVALPGAAGDDPPALASLLAQTLAAVDDRGVPGVAIERDLGAGAPLVADSRRPGAPAGLVVRPAA